MRRIMTALPLALLVTAITWWAPRWLFFLVLVTAVEISLQEFFALSRHAGFKAFSALGYAMGGFVCLAQALALLQPASLVLGALILVVFSTLGIALLWTSDLKDYLGSAAATMLGVLYVAFTLSWLMPLRFSEKHSSAGTSGREVILFLFLVVWGGDVFAFLVGSSLGRTPLAPRTSPKKTVEGAVGGLAGSLVLAWAFTRWFWQTADLKTVMLLAGLVAVAGQIGDLVESALKRGADVKDSGTLLPGHGGLLDRVDSLLFGAPALWLGLMITDFWRP